MSNALNAEYRKVITAKYLDKPCTTCGGALVTGDYAATNDFKDWHSYCARCAASETAQIAGLIARIEARVEPLGANVPVEITQIVDQATPGVEAILMNGDLTTFKATKALLLSVLTLSTRATATPDPLIDALKAIHATGDRDSGFAGSLVSGFSKYGSLTTGQRSAAERMIAERARKAEAAAQSRSALEQRMAEARKPVPVVPFGLYRDDDGTIHRVYKTNRRGISARKYNGRIFVHQGAVGLRHLDAGLKAGTTRLLNAAEASAFGKSIGRCFNCLSIGRPGKLSDDRSLAVGYGEVCANHNGWWYPTEDEAAQILRGDINLDDKLTQAIATGTTLPAAPDASESEAITQAIEKGEPVVLPELDDIDLFIDEDEDEDEPLIIEGVVLDDDEDTNNPEWEEGEDEDEIVVPVAGSNPQTFRPMTAEDVMASPVFAPLSEDTRKRIAGDATTSIGKAARDLLVGEHIIGYGMITAIDTSVTPGVVYVWLDGRARDLPADLVLNHGDPIKVNAVLPFDRHEAAARAVREVAEALDAVEAEREASLDPEALSQYRTVKQMMATIPTEASVVPVEARNEVAAPVAHDACVRCEDEPATTTFVCHDGEAFKVCRSCRSALVRYRVCPFHDA